MTDTPIDQETTDPNVWGIALWQALHDWPDKVNNPEAFASYFKTAIEAGRRAERNKAEADRRFLLRVMKAVR